MIVNWIMAHSTEIAAVVLAFFGLCMLLFYSRLKTRYAVLKAQYDTTQAQHESANAELVSLQEKYTDMQLKAELQAQQLSHTQQQRHTEEKMLENSMKTAELAMQTKGKEVLQQEAKQFTQHTMQEFEKLTQRVSLLQERVFENDNSVSTLWKALEQPGQVGQLSEIGLENALKAHGLTAGQDFVMQYSAEGKRPDAVVFLPNNHALAIDSKASKFFLELAATDDPVQSEIIKDKLRMRMREHLRALSEKAYQTVIEKIYKTETQEQKMLQHKVAMFIHRESQLELLHEIDPGFRQEAAKHNIMVVGPTGLGVLLNFASYSLQMVKQDANQQHIIAEITNLMDSVRVVLEHTSKVGDSVRRTSDLFQKLSASINRTMLPKAKKIEALGIQLPKGKALPTHIKENAGNVVELGVSAAEE